jgi:tRNA (mo5U34)-methyltransferase
MSKTPSLSLRDRIAAREWYHKIDLGSGITTPGRNYDDQWAMVRRLKRHISYTGKRVLDLASYDGMWAFEAEQHGASFVVATDRYPYALENFLICREALGSAVQPFYNASVYDIRRALEPLLYEAPATDAIERNFFDVIQNFGLMYHLRDPMYALAACRSVIKERGFLILETAAILDDDRSFMVLNGYPGEPRIYPDPATWWAMTVPCLQEMLLASLFRPRMDTMETLHQFIVDGRSIGRVGLVAEAIAPTAMTDLPDVLVDLYMRPYDSPGAMLDHYRKKLDT